MIPIFARFDRGYLVTGQRSEFQAKKWIPKKWAEEVESKDSGLLKHLEFVGQGTGEEGDEQTGSRLVCRATSPGPIAKGWAVHTQDEILQGLAECARCGAER